MFVARAVVLASAYKAEAEAKTEPAARRRAAATFRALMRCLADGWRTSISALFIH